MFWSYWQTAYLACSSVLDIRFHIVKYLTGISGVVRLPGGSVFSRDLQALRCTSRRWKDLHQADEIEYEADLAFRAETEASGDGPFVNSLGQLYYPEDYYDC